MSGAGGSGAGGAGGSGGEALPDPTTFTSGVHGTVGGKRGLLRRLADRGLNAWLMLSGTRHRIRKLAKGTPRRTVLVASLYAPESNCIGPALDELRASRHDVQVTAASTEELRDGKFENLAQLLTGEEWRDWTLIVDDDICLPRNFLDGFVAIAEALEFDLAQPAQTLGSHAAWSSARRVPFSVARQTNFVEIGPVTAFSRAAAQALLPPPPLKMGWGLDLHWAAVAEERGWKIGVIDALPVRHETRPVGGAYSGADATAEAQRFLAGRPYVHAAEVGRTLQEYRTVPR
jgi:hypothetical protein